MLVPAAKFRSPLASSLAPVPTLTVLCGVISEIEMASTTVATPNVSALTFAWTSPVPRAESRMSPRLVRIASAPMLTCETFAMLRTMLSALAPDNAPPVVKLTLSRAKMLFNVLSVIAPGLSSRPMTFNVALLPTKICVSKSTMVSLLALAPATRPPVVPRMFSESSSGLVALLDVSTRIPIASIETLLPIVVRVIALTVLSTLAPAPASNPPANVWTRPLTADFPKLLMFRSPDKSMFEPSPMLTNVVPLFVVAELADAPAAMPPLPANVSANCDCALSAEIDSDPPVNATS